MKRPRRPDVFNESAIRDYFAARDLDDGTVNSIVSGMRLLIPLLIRDVGAEKMVEIWDSFWRHLDSSSKPDGRAKKNIPQILQWANDCLDKYEDDKQSV